MEVDTPLGQEEKSPEKAGRTEAKDYFKAPSNEGTEVRHKKKSHKNRNRTDDEESDASIMSVASSMSSRGKKRKLATDNNRETDARNQHELTGRHKC